MRVMELFTCTIEALTIVDWLICVRLTAPIESPNTTIAAELLAVTVVSEVLTLANDELMPVTDDPKLVKLELTFPRLTLVEDSALLTILTFEFVVESEDDSPAVDVLTLPRLVLTPPSDVLTPPSEVLTFPKLVLTLPRLELISV